MESSSQFVDQSLTECTYCNMMPSIDSYSSPESGSSSSGTGFYNTSMIGRNLAQIDMSRDTFAARQMITDSVRVPTSEHVAQIVGKSGAKIKSLRASTNTCIKTPHRGDDPIFTITGQQTDVQRAKDAIEKAAKHFSQLMDAKMNQPNDGEIIMHVPVPQQYVGVVVGRAGTVIMKIKEQTNTRINTPREDTENPLFEITGTRVNVQAAKEAIEERVKQAHALRASACFDPMLKDRNTAATMEQYYQMPHIPNQTAFYTPFLSESYTEMTQNPVQAFPGTRFIKGINYNHDIAADVIKSDFINNNNNNDVRFNDDRFNSNF